MFPKMVCILKIAAEPSFKSLFTQLLCKGVFNKETDSKTNELDVGLKLKEVSLCLRQYKTLRNGGRK